MGFCYFFKLQTKTNKYREATFAVGYFGDSILNSIFDTPWMLLGF